MDFHKFFVTNRLKCLVIVKNSIMFKVFVTSMLNIPFISLIIFAPDNHISVRVDRFLRYLKKYQCIATTNAQISVAWDQGM